jgi:hypothetical protein
MVWRWRSLLLAGLWPADEDISDFDGLASILMASSNISRLNQLFCPIIPTKNISTSLVNETLEISFHSPLVLGSSHDTFTIHSCTPLLQTASNISRRQSTSGADKTTKVDCVREVVLEERYDIRHCRSVCRTGDGWREVEEKMSRDWVTSV